MSNKFSILFIVAICCLMTSYANNPQFKPNNVFATCPAPTEQMLKCLGQYACQHAIRLDLRCLLNLNGTPLLGGLLGGTGGGLLGGGGGGGNRGGGGGLLGGGLLGGGNGSPGGGTGIVGSLLGR